MDMAQHRMQRREARRSIAGWQHKSWEEREKHRRRGYVAEQMLVVADLWVWRWDDRRCFRTRWFSCREAHRELLPPAYCRERSGSAEAAGAGIGAMQSTDGGREVVVSMGC